MTTPPPPSRLVPGAAQLTIKGNADSQPFAIVLGVSGQVGGVGAAFATAWLNHAWQAFRPCMADGVIATGATLRQLDVAQALPFDVGPPTQPNGGLAGVRAIAAGCSLIKWSTATGGRSGRGRTFLPGLLASHVGADGRSYTTAHANTISASATAYLNNALWTNESVRPAVISFRRNAAYPILTGQAASVLGLQRRRMRA